MDQPTVAMRMVSYRHYSNSNSYINDSDNTGEGGRGLEEQSKTVENVILRNSDLFFSTPQQQQQQPQPQPAEGSTMMVKMTHRGQGGGGGGHGGAQPGDGHKVGGGFDFSPAAMSVPSCSSFSTFNSSSSAAPPLLSTILPSGATALSTEAERLESTTTTTTTAEGAISSGGIISKILQELDSTFTEDVDFTAEPAVFEDAAASSVVGGKSQPPQPPPAASLTSVFSSTSSLQQGGEEDKGEDNFSATFNREMRFL